VLTLALGIPVVAGRGIEDTDRQGTPGAVVINRRMADVFWPGVDPVGRPIQIDGGPTATVVGIVGDVRSVAIVEPPQPEMFVPLARSCSGLTRASH